MLAIQVADDQSLSYRETAEPELAPDGVILEVRATAVNRADLLQRRGLYPVPSWASPVMGLEASGVVVEVGDRVEGWEIGDRACALLSGGGYAQRAAVPADHLLRMPDDMSFVDAAGIPEVFLTAFLNVYIEAAAQPGEWLMIHAAASGVGTAALQLAGLFDNPVIGTASGHKLEALEQWNPARLVDRKTESFVDAVREETEGRGVDVILDPVGADYLQDNLDSLAKCGRLVSIGLLSGAQSEINLGTVLRNRLKLIGSVLRPRSDREKARIIDAFREQAWPSFESGRLRAVIDRTFPIEQTDEAHQLLRSNDTIGKIVLEVSAHHG